LTNMTKKKTIKAWMVLGKKSDKGQIVYDSGYPMVYIQIIKPTVFLRGCSKKQEVVPCTITY